MEKHKFVRFLVQGLSAAVLIVALTGLASAQMMRMTPEERANRLKDSLSLSPKQTDQVKAIFEDNQKAMQEIFQSGIEDRDSMRVVMQAQMKKTDENIAKLLTPEQKTKYEEMIKNRPQWGRRPAGQ